MSTRLTYICDGIYCEAEFKVEHAGGKTQDFVNLMYEYPVTHLRLTDTRSDNYDFCSVGCLERWLK